MRRISSLRYAVLGVCALSSATSAAVITMDAGPFPPKGTLSGDGLSLLVLQDSGSTRDGREAGSVLWNGTGDVRSGEAKNESVTRTASALTSAGVDATNFGIVFHSSQAANQALDLNEFTLRFAEADGDTLFDATYTATPQTRRLSGKKDFSFHVQLTPEEAASFFGNGSNRLGMLVTDPIANVASGGPDRFFVFATTPIPEPAAMSIVTLAAGVLTLRRRSRR